MADVQLENGYIRIATEMMNEIIRRDFSKRQLAILHLIIRLSYGCHRKNCSINKFKDFEIAGINKVDIKKELEFLRECKVIIWEEETMVFAIDKDYEKWQITPSKGYNKTKFDQLIHENLKRKDSKKKRDKDDDEVKHNYFTEYEKTFGYPPALLISDFNYWIDSDESQFAEPEDIIIEVIRRAKKQIPRNPAKYVSKILKDLHNMELYTLDAVIAYNKKFDEKIANGGSNDGKKVPQPRRGYGGSPQKSAEQAIREAEEARKSWGG